MTGGYICIKLDLKSAYALKVIADRLQLQLDEDLHCTLMYDENDPKTPVPFNTDKFPYNRNSVVKASVMGYRVMGDKIALAIESPQIRDMNKALKKLGFKHSFRVYVPHVSLCDALDIEPQIMDMFLANCPTSLLFSTFLQKPIN